jgi:hypothetical protein
MCISQWLLALTLIIAIVIFYQTMPRRQETFGMSPGTMDQLASTRSPRFIQY